MIEKLNPHYSMTNPASVYDEEALTALELAGRTASKVNEVITDQNTLREETETRLTKMEDVQIPAEVTAEVQEQIDNGTFDQQISKYTNDLEARLNNLIGGVEEGVTQLDAEVIDIRLGADNEEYQSAGNAVRGQAKKVRNIAGGYVYQTGTKYLTKTDAGSGTLSVHIREALGYRCKGQYGTIDFSSACSGLSGVSVASSSEASFQIPAFNSLVFNLESKKMFYRANNALEVSDIVVIENAHGKAVGGTLIADYVANHLQAPEVCFLGSGATLTIEKQADNSGYKVSFPYRLSVITDQSVAIEWSTAIPSEWVTDGIFTINGDNSAVLNLPNHFAFVYNYQLGKFALRESGKITDGDIILIQNAWMNLIGGCLMMEQYGKEISTLKSSGGSGSTPIVQDEAVSRFMAKLDELSAAGKKPETFLFFTDPHLITGSGFEAEFDRYMSKVQEVASTCPVNFVVCGGDWLNAHTKEEALNGLAYVAGQMKARFPNLPFLHVNGNHDNNYQGGNSAIIGGNALVNILYPEKGSMYYAVETEQSFIYVFDSGIDGLSERPNQDLSEYEWAQIKWFCQSIEKRYDAGDTKQTIAFIHIPFEGGGYEYEYEENDDGEQVIVDQYQISGVDTPLTRAINGVLSALVNSTEIEMELTWFDDETDYTESPFTKYTNPRYAPAMLIGGHKHEDIFDDGGEMNGGDPLPRITRTHIQAGGEPTFDICLYCNNILYAYRVGTGVDLIAEGREL